MASDGLVEQIVRLLDVRLLDPLEVLLEGDDAVDALRGALGTPVPEAEPSTATGDADPEGRR